MPVSDPFPAIDPTRIERPASTSPSRPSQYAAASPGASGRRKPFAPPPSTASTSRSVSSGSLLRASSAAISIAEVWGVHDADSRKAGALALSDPPFEHVHVGQRVEAEQRRICHGTLGKQ